MNIKKILFGIVFSLLTLVVFVKPSFAATNWNLTGNYVIEFAVGTGSYDTNHYDLSLTQTNGDLTGVGQYPDPGPYSYAWDAAGSITGDSFTLTDTYTLGAVGTVMHMQGSVAPDGSISGTWDDNYGGGRTGTWKTVSGSANPLCIPTGFYRDGVNMTANLINPTDVVTGEVNATGCNVGVFYGPGNTGTVDDANIHGANYYGIVVQRASVIVQNSNVHNIGEVSFNGMQHGVAIYYANITGVSNGDCTTTGSTNGYVYNNTVSLYQKGGIVVTCPNTKVDVTNNTVTGNGPVDYIAQNGIQVSFGASGNVMRNTVTGNSYTGKNGASSGGILVVGGEAFGSGLPYSAGFSIDNNTLTGNDVGVFIYNADASYNAPSSKTNIKVVNNVISYDALNNVSGNGSTGYQAGVSDFGNNDKIINNKISGDGYNSTKYPLQAFSIDTSGSSYTKVHANK